MLTPECTRRLLVGALRNAPTDQQWLSEHDLAVLADAALTALGVRPSRLWLLWRRAFTGGLTFRP